MTKTRYQICTKLVVDTSDPNIKFDQNGVSNHFHDFKANVEPNWNTGAAGYAALQKAVERIKEAGKGKDFDCLMGMSGGADSSYMLHKMVTEFGLRPLVFHVDTGWNSEIAVHNINCIVDKLGLDLFTEVINWEEVRDFQLAMFKSGLPNIDGPQDIANIGVLFQYAAKHGSKTAVLKPEENTKPSVAYKGHNKEMEKKIPKGRIHDPYSYEIETWAQLEAEFPKRKRVQWARVEPAKNMMAYRPNPGGIGNAKTGSKT